MSSRGNERCSGRNNKPLYFTVLFIRTGEVNLHRYDYRDPEYVKKRIAECKKLEKLAKKSDGFMKKYKKKCRVRK
jgi:hypothetical protein